jgi:poly-gamma-glutamate capsule biosynthesis protein CapA/YwtB (metallophosphatase superfamily)
VEFKLSDEQKTIYGVLAIVIVGLGLWSWLSRPPQVSQPAQSSPVNLLLVGDINLGRQTGQKILAGDNNYAFEYLNERLNEYDVTFGNLESQLVDLNGETQSPTNEYRFAGPPAGADGLKEAGFDVVSIANNHMWDYGKDALFSTIDNLDRVGIKHVGASEDPTTLYQPAIITAQQQKIAFFAVTNLLNGYEKSGATEYVAWADADKLIPAIEQVKPQVDWVIVSVHWGSEYTAQPNRAQIELGRKLIDAGVNVVVGHHPHVPQGVEEYNGGIIFYSLGNFAFWQPFDYWTQHSFMAEVTLRPSTGEVQYNPVAISAGWQPRLATDKDEVKILQYIAKLSEAFNK